VNQWLRILIGFLSLIFLAATGDLLRQGEEMFAVDKLAEAADVFERVLAQEPGSARARYMLGRVRFLEGDLDSALKELEKAVDLGPENVEHRLFLAKLYGQKTRGAAFLAAPFWARKWLRELETSHRLEPANVEARSRLFQYYINAPAIGGGDKKAAIELAKETIALDETRGRLLLAEAYRKTDRLDEAVGEYEKLLALDPVNVTAHREMGNVAMARFDQAAAEGWFRKAVEIAPEDPAALESLGDYYARRGMRSRAIEAYLAVLSIAPKESEARFSLAKQYEELGRTEDAARQYQMLLDLTPSSFHAPEARERLDRIKR